MRNRNLFFNIVTVIAICVVTLASNQTLSAQDATVSFENDVKPILEDHCIKCHGEVDYEDCRLDIKKEAMVYISVGDAENSQMYEHLISLEEDEIMPPPDDNNPLDSDEIETIKRWIDGGAEWPDGMSLVSTQTEEANATGDADDAKAEDPDANLIFNAAGSLHPAVVHLPIGLLLAAGLFALFGLRGNFVMSDCAYYCLWLGTFGSILACVSGWWFSPMEGVGTVSELQDVLDQDHKVFWHRTGGLVVTVAAFLLALFAAGARNRDPDDGIMWKLGLILLAAGVGWTGHEGGKLTHGENHYKDLKKFIQTLMPADGGAVEKKADDKSDGGDSDADKADGDAGEPAKASDADTASAATPILNL